jgi:hypothetical protein
MITKSSPIPAIKTLNGRFDIYLSNLILKISKTFEMEN